MSWRRIRFLVWKEFTQIRRDKAMLPILFVMPLLQLILFGYVVGSDVRNLRLAVLDNDHSVQSQRVVDTFTGSGYFTLVAQPSNEAGVKQILDGSQAVIALEIPRGFGASIQSRHAQQIGVVIDGSDSRTGNVAAGYAQGIIANLSNQFYASP